MAVDMHDAPFLRLSDPALLRRFCHDAGIIPPLDRSTLVSSVAAAFSRLPYENLTKIVKRNSVFSARSAMRYPDEVIRDWLDLGTGGTCFSLTAAIIAVYGGLGIEAHPLLADRHYGPDTHCGLVIPDGGTLLLLDPGYLLYTPLPLPRSEPGRVERGMNTVELVPLDGGSRVELWTVVNGNRKLRLTYKVAVADAASFARAWENSFAWEMMTYPVLTLSRGTEHLYLQGKRVRIRGGASPGTMDLNPDQLGRFVVQSLGIDRSVVSRALEIVSYGANAPAGTR